MCGLLHANQILGQFVSVAGSFAQEQFVDAAGAACCFARAAPVKDDVREALRGGLAPPGSIPAAAAGQDGNFGRDLTGPVAANQLAAGAFFSVKMTIQDFTSPVAANQLAAGAFFS